MTPKWPQSDPKLIPKMIPKWPQSDPKMIPKVTQKWSPKWTKIDPKMSPWGPEVVPKEPDDDRTQKKPPSPPLIVGSSDLELSRLWFLCLCSSLLLQSVDEALQLDEVHADWVRSSLRLINACIVFSQLEVALFAFLRMENYPWIRRKIFWKRLMNKLDVQVCLGYSKSLHSELRCQPCDMSS